jgi:lipopolysaccharide transport system permease protein/teichoic acid transport system permease protein
VKKIVFRVSMLPVVKLLSALIVHVFFVMVIFIVLAVYYIHPSLHAIQVVYYCFSAIILILGLSWMTAAMTVFFKDVGQLVSMLLQFGFWLTPIFWPIHVVPSKYQTIIKLNPFYYITEGYRDSFVHRVWFWEHLSYTCYFWFITCVLFALGAIIFLRLRPHFADVL